MLIELVSIPFNPGSSNKRFVLYNVGSDVIAHSIKLMFSLPCWNKWDKYLFKAQGKFFVIIVMKEILLSVSQIETSHLLAVYFSQVKA